MAKKRAVKKKAEVGSLEAQSERLEFLFQAVVTLFLLSVYGFYLAQKIDLTAADLGRHLKNGEVFLKTFSVPNINLYSYTHPDYPFINHHWGSGVIFYWIERLFGFSGLSVFSILLSLLTFLMFFILAARYGSFRLAAPIALIMLPVLISRHRMRPEIFTYFLSGVFLYALWNYREQRLEFRWLFILPVLQALWVNLHIYFFIGIGITAVFFFESCLRWLLTKEGQAKESARQLGLIQMLILLASCVNPYGIVGVLYPVQILNEYGYPVLENRSVGSLINSRVEFLPLTYFKIAFGLLWVSWVYAMVQVRRYCSLGNLILALAVSVAALLAIRNFALFGYFALPLTAVNLKDLKIIPKSMQARSKLFLCGVMLIVLLGLVSVKPVYFLSGNQRTWGFGLAKGVEVSAEFFRRENIKGRIFNNYDVGSYLIYYLYPDHRVFVDNRPEAYPESFFRDLYVPMQLDETKWQSVDDLYRFNVIFFHHRDITPWGQPFIVRRVFDPMWAPVYLDDNVIILLKRYGPNQSTIAKYEIPKEKVLE